MCVGETSYFQLLQGDLNSKKIIQRNTSAWLVGSALLPKSSAPLLSVYSKRPSNLNFSLLFNWRFHFEATCINRKSFTLTHHSLIDNKSEWIILNRNISRQFRAVREQKVFFHQTNFHCKIRWRQNSVSCSKERTYCNFRVGSGLGWLRYRKSLKYGFS